jgi:hypothetical protein
VSEANRLTDNTPTRLGRIQKELGTMWLGCHGMRKARDCSSGHSLSGRARGVQQLVLKGKQNSARALVARTTRQHARASKCAIERHATRANSTRATDRPSRGRAGEQKGGVRDLTCLSIVTPPFLNRDDVTRSDVNTGVTPRHPALLNKDWLARCGLA